MGEFGASVDNKGVLVILIRQARRRATGSGSGPTDRLFGVGSGYPPGNHCVTYRLPDPPPTV